MQDSGNEANGSERDVGSSARPLKSERRRKQRPDTTQTASEPKTKKQKKKKKTLQANLQETSSGSQITLEKNLSYGNQEVNVVGNDKEMLSTAEGDAQYCVVGSPEHLKALMDNMKYVRSEYHRLVEERRLLTEQIHKLHKKDAKIAAQIRVVHKLQQINTEEMELDALPLPNEPESSPDHHEKSQVHNSHQDEIRKHHEKANEHMVNEAVRKFGEVKSLKLIEHKKEESLIKRARVRQFFQGQTLHREATHRKAAEYELFFDLVFVGVIHQLGELVSLESLQEDASFNIQQFIVCFIPIWKIWFETNIVLNVYDAGDLKTQIALFLIMFFTMVMGSCVKYALNETLNLFLGCYIITRLILCIFRAFNGIAIPAFRLPVFRGVTSQLIPLAIWCGAFYYADDPQTALAYFWAACLIDVWFDWMFMTMMRIPFLKRFKSEYNNALNIEHYSERFGLLTLIAFGEIINNVLIVAPPTSIPSASAGVIAMGLLFAFSLQFLYFHVDGSRSFVHAIRRSTVTGILFSMFRLPLQIAIIAAGSALGTLTNAAEEYQELLQQPWSEDIQAQMDTLVPSTIRWVFCVAAAAVLFMMDLISILHEGKDKPGLTNLSKHYRVLMRLVVTIIIVFLPFAGSALSPIGLTAIPATLVAALIVFELWTSLKRPEKVFGADHKTVMAMVAVTAGTPIQKEPKDDDDNLPYRGQSLKDTFTISRRNKAGSKSSEQLTATDSSVV